MNTILIALLCVMSLILLLLVIYTVAFLVVTIKALKQVRLAAEKVQESADQASELVDEVRRTVVNPGIIGVLIEKYLHGRSKTKKRDIISLSHIVQVFHIATGILGHCFNPVTN